MNYCLPKIIVTGGDGQVAKSIADLSQTSRAKILFCNRNELDITSTTSIHNALTFHQPSLVINTAAYTAVDRAEKESDLAFKVNTDGAKNLALICAELNIRLIHLSTDYVFNGCKQKPYVEDDTTNPLNQYGLSKLKGEYEVLKHHREAIILRVSAVFSSYGSNFVKTILRLATERESLTIVNDQFTCPTFAHDIARILLQIAERKLAPGIYHYCSDEIISWHDFASVILQTAREFSSQYDKKILPVASSAFSNATKRPSYSVLCSDKISQALQITPPSWRHGLQQIIFQMIPNGSTEGV